MLSLDLVVRQIKKLNKELSEINSDFICQFPIEYYLKDIHSYHVLYDYSYISLELKTVLYNIRSTYSDHALALYHKLAVLFFIKEFIQNSPYPNIPYSVLSLYHNWFERIFEDLSMQPDDYYSHRNDSFLKDLGICSLRNIPVGGAWIVEISGIGRKFLITGGFRQFFKASLFTLFHMGGFKPYYQVHTVDRYIKGFNSEERDKCYLRIAELLKLNPEVKGMVAGSWFYDPSLKNVSPRLTYLIKKPMLYGAKVFRLGTEESDIKLALMKSPTRRKLYQEGRYIPTRYLIVWPRKYMLIWAEQHSKIDATKDR